MEGPWIGFSEAGLSATLWKKWVRRREAAGLGGSRLMERRRRRRKRDMVETILRETKKC